jgi:hypothetical protein
MNNAVNSQYDVATSGNPKSKLKNLKSDVRP